jgi:peptidoglycan/xylan/chitin deacetylase (PgdA/CDA1 family)
VYHRVEPGFALSSTSTSAENFKKQMIYLIQSGYKGVELELRIERRKENEFALTFDDALLCLYTNAVPVLKELKIPATFFIVSNFIGKTSSWDVYKELHLSHEQIKELIGLGFKIGSHTANHPDLTRISSQAVFYELSTSKKSLEDAFGVPVNYLSYPFGRFNEETQKIAKDCGYKGAITINHPLKETKDDRYAINGNAVYIFNGGRSALIKAAGGRGYRTAELISKIMNRFAGGTALVVGK